MKRCSTEDFLERVRGGLIVSCQALPDEPLHGSLLMSRMALAASLGGAAGIRANSVEDIQAISKTVDLPIIGLIKRVYPDAPQVYITPTLAEVDALAACNVAVIALDATARPRPGGENLDRLFARAREKYPSQLFMADCATLAEGLHAASLGFDLIGTTLAGYTEDTRGRDLPDFALLEDLVRGCKRPVVAEGGIWTPAELRRALDLGAHAAVVGSAITRPLEITRRFVAALTP